MRCSIASSTMFTQKTPVSRMLRSESFTPVEANMTCGGV